MEADATFSQDQFAAAYRLGFSRTVRFLQSSGVQYELAEETAQAAWSRGWERRGQIRNPAAVSIWVNSIAKNLLRADFRRRKFVEEITEASATVRASTDSTALAELLSYCSEEDRTLLVRHYMEGWSSNELAPALGITPVSVRVRLLRIKNSLRESLQVSGVGRPAPQLTGYPQILNPGL